MICTSWTWTAWIQNITFNCHLYEIRLSRASYTLPPNSLPFRLPSHKISFYCSPNKNINFSSLQISVLFCIQGCNTSHTYLDNSATLLCVYLSVIQSSLEMGRGKTRKACVPLFLTLTQIVVFFPFAAWQVSLSNWCTVKLSFLPFPFPTIRKKERYIKEISLRDVAICEAESEPHTQVDLNKQL